MTSNGPHLGLAMPFMGDAMPQWHDLKNEIKNAEQVGFSECLIPDRPTYHLPTADALTATAVAATCTDTINIISVCIVGYRNPVLLAKAMSTINGISDGRLVLAAALGGDFPKEYNAFGIMDKGELVPRLEDGIAICRRLWSGEAIDHQGTFLSITNLQELPSMTQPLPIWLAHRGHVGPSTDRTARIADGWLASWVSPRRLRASSEEIRTRAQDYGRNASSIKIAAMVRVYLAANVKDASEKMAARRTALYGHPYEPDRVQHLQVGGPPDYCLQRLEEFCDAGAEYLIIQLECDAAERRAQMAWLLEDVIRPGTKAHKAELRL